MRSAAIWWIRRDLRLADNSALARAKELAHNVLPVFVLDPSLHKSTYVGEKRLAFLYGGLQALDAQLQERGSRLIVLQGEPRQVLADLVQETAATAIFAEQDYSPYARQRDHEIRELLPLLHLTDGLTGLPVGSVRKADGDPYMVYTPFNRRWLAQRQPQKEDIRPAPKQLQTSSDVEGMAVPTEPKLPESVPFPPGEEEALARLKAFVMGDDPPIYRYDETRDRPAVSGTARLSPYLRFGMISARRAVVAARHAIDRAPTQTARSNAQTWLSELIWRDFYVNVLHYFPHVRGESFRREYDQIDWCNDEDEFQAWTEGRTGYPFVDAAMRQLSATGWMHNRARMVVASFLVKDLLIDWRWGERWFMQHLVDGDPAANNGGWQWAAGTGTDAAPYFRIFNPISQSEKYDPDGEYIRTWVPELAEVPQNFIHAPWKMPEAEQEESGCRIGQEYPGPIVDHGEARQRALDVYGAVK